MRCVLPGCTADATEPIEVGFNELHGTQLEPASESIWVCATHKDEIARQILTAALEDAR